MGFVTVGEVMSRRSKVSRSLLFGVKDYRLSKVWCILGIIIP